MIEEKQKKIYNSFLRATRASKNKPYRLRQNFDNITPTVELALKKLDSFFSAHPTIRYYDFFIAPYNVYKDQEFFDLKFYTTYKAIKCYATHIKQLEFEDVDSDMVIERCKDCCVNIYKFCRENKITLEEYKTRQEGAIPLYMQHLKEHRINFYTLHSLDVKVPSTREDTEVFKFMFDDFHTTLHTTRLKFIKSTRLKETLRSALHKIEDKLLILHKDNIL